MSSSEQTGLTAPPAPGAQFAAQQTFAPQALGQQPFVQQPFGQQPLPPGLRWAPEGWSAQAASPLQGTIPPPTRSADARRPPGTLRELLEDQAAYLREGLAAWRSQQLARRAMRRRIERYLDAAGLDAGSLLGPPSWPPPTAAVPQPPVPQVPRPPAPQVPHPPASQVPQPAAAPVAQLPVAPVPDPAAAPVRQPPPAPPGAVEADSLARWLHNREARHAPAGSQIDSEIPPQAEQQEAEAEVEQQEAEADEPEAEAEQSTPEAGQPDLEAGQPTSEAAPPPQAPPASSWLPPERSE